MNIFLIVLAALVLLITIAHTHRRKQAKNKVLLVIDDNCTGCQRCVKRCKRKALEIANKKVVLSPDRCTTCGNCVPLCKFSALEIINRESK